MMSIVLKWIVFFILCIILQSTLISSVSILGISPDCVLLALFLLSIKHGTLPGIYVGFLLGLLQDLYSPSILGQNALAKTVVGAIIGLFNEKVMRTDPILRMILILLAFVVHDSLFVISDIIKIAAPVSLLFKELLTRTLPRTLYSMVLLAIVYVWDYFLKPLIQR